LLAAGAKEEAGASMFASVASKFELSSSTENTEDILFKDVRFYFCAAADALGSAFFSSSGALF